MKQIFGVIILLTIGIFGLSFLRIKKVICKTPQNECTDYQEKIVNQTFIGLPLLFKDYHTEKSSIPWRLITIKKNFPNSIEVLIDTQQLNIQFETEGEFWVLTQTGNLISTNKKDLITVLMNKQILNELNSNIFPSHLIDELNTLSTWASQNQDLSPSFNWEDSNTLVITTNNYPKILTNPNNLLSNLSNFDLIRKNLDLDSFDSPILSLDLRFDLPILKTVDSNLLINQPIIASDSAQNVASQSSETISTYQQ